MALPTENQWADPRDRPSFQSIFNSLDASFMLDVTNSVMEQDIDNIREVLADDDYGTRGFPEDRGRPRGSDAPEYVPLEMPKMKRARCRLYRLRPTLKMKQLQIRRAMRLERREQSQRSIKQLQLEKKPRYILPGSHIAQRASEPFEKLPTEVLTQIIGYTHIDTIPKLERSLTRLGSVLIANPKASYDAILITQYQHWMKALGGTSLRDERQKANLIRAIASISHGAWVIVARSKHINVHNLISNVRAMIRSDEYCQREYVILLDYLESRLDRTIGHLTAFCKFRITKAAIVCLERCSYRQLRIGKDSQDERTSTRDLTWRERQEVFEEQDDQTKLEVRCILESVVCQTVNRLDFFKPLSIDDILEAYEQVEDQMNPKKFLLQTARWATALLLNTIFSNERGMVLVTQISQSRYLSPVEALELSRLEVHICDEWAYNVRTGAAQVGSWQSSFPDDTTAFIEATGLNLLSVVAGSELEAKLMAKQREMVDGVYTSVLG